jgi:hypothetical protein
LAELEGVLSGIEERTAERDFGDAGVPGGLGYGCSGYPQKGSEMATLSLGCCHVCGGALSGPGRYCSRTCGTMMAAFLEFLTLRSILMNARWAGAPSQEVARKKYLQMRMSKGVKRLSISSDVSSEVLVEIAEIVEYGW